MTNRMKTDWNRRAREDARHHIANGVPAGEANFTESGLRDVAIFFTELEHLLAPDRTVLDIGCGIGRMDQHIVNRVRRLVGVDVSGEMVRRARARLAAAHNATFVELNGRDLAPIASGSIDLIFSHIVFQHMPKSAVWSYFVEARRALRRGGDFVFQVPEVNDSTPDDPPEDETLKVRFYGEDEVARRLTMLGLRHVGTARFYVETPIIGFHQMRIHAQRP